MSASPPEARGRAEPPAPSPSAGITRRRVATYAAIGLVPVLMGTVLAGYDIWRDSSLNVKTKDAQIAAAVVSAQSTVAGRLARYTVDVGDVVQQGDVLASLSAGIPAVAGATLPSAASPNRFTVNVRAPVSGTILSKTSVDGSGVSAGQTLLTIGDLENVWVVANVEESRVAKVRVGQPAKVRIDAVNRTFEGHVAEITPATSGALAAPAQTRAGGASASSRPIQTVPVRIVLDRARSDGKSTWLLPGMSAEITIDLR